MSQGNKSVISDDMQNLNHGPEDIANQIRGHKANISNPNTSEESKKDSAEAVAGLANEADMIAAKDSTSTNRQ